MIKRHGITDEQWERIKDMVTTERSGGKGRPAKDNRTMINAIIWVLKTGAPWRDLPERFGSWQSAYCRFSRWSVFCQANFLKKAGHLRTTKQSHTLSVERPTDGEEKEMLKMTQIDCIQEMQAKRLKQSEICEKLDLDPKTVRKYMKHENFSPLPPAKRISPSKLDPYKPVIEEMLNHDDKHWHKQHHTAKRICDRLQ